MKKSILTGILTTVLVSTCAAQNWYPVNVPTNERLNDIEFASSTIGYIVGENGTFLKTTDGGQTWSNTNPTWNGNSFGTLSLLDISFVSETIGYLVLEGAQGTVKTLDGGQTWSDLPANTTNQCFANCVYSFAEDDLMIGGSDCFQGATITQFQTPTWTVQTVNYTTFDTNHKINQIDFEGNLGVAAINNEFMLRSVDFGQTWDTVRDRKSVV